jgi:hypothetical protein
MDLLTLKMPEYLDSSTRKNNKNEDLDLISLVKETQSREKIEVTMELVFYMR